MPDFGNMKVGTKILGTVCIILVLLAVVAGVGILKMRSIGAEIEEIAEQDIPMSRGADEVGNLQMDMKVLFERAVRFAITGDGAELKKSEEEFAKLTRQSGEEIRKLEVVTEKGVRSADSAAARKELQDLAAQIKNIEKQKAEFEKEVTQVFEIARGGKLGGLSALTNRVEKESDDVEKALDEFVKNIGKFTEDSAKQAEKDEKSAIAIMSVAAVAAVILGLAFGLLVNRGITRALGRVAASLSEGASQVASASGQLSASSQALAEGSSESAASLEETASAMEEMSAMTKRNTESAGQAKTLSDRAGSSVEKANESMLHLTGQMAEISSTGEEIGKIIRTIDEIAFQTNLLALNAAVEAARAGEAGAGFAVVADEVRNLAQRAAAAAKNTSELIEGTIKRIKDGTELVEKTNADFTEVTDSVKKVAELVSEVSAASSEQSRGIGEVSTAVSQMDKVTQANAASAEEIASASEEMNAQALSLQEIVRTLQAMTNGSGSSMSADTVTRLSSTPGNGRRIPHAGKARMALSPPSPAAAPARHGGNGKRHPGAPLKPEEMIPLEDKPMESF